MLTFIRFGIDFSNNITGCPSTQRNWLRNTLKSSWCVYVMFNLNILFPAEAALGPLVTKMTKYETKQK